MSALRLEAFIDGASRGNPGPASTGVFIRDHQTQEVLKEHSRALGITTNNIAEYTALLDLLGILSKEFSECSEIRIHADSLLMVSQIKGRYKVKHPGLKPLYAEAIKNLKAATYRWDIVHVARELNHEADRLANEALDNL